MLSCHLYRMPYSNINDLYNALKKISDKPYIYIRQTRFIENKQEPLYAAFYNIRKTQNDVILGSFGYQYLTKEFNVRLRKLEPKIGNITIDFAIFNYGNTTYLCVFSERVDNLIQELERKLFGRYQGKTNIVYITREQLKNILNGIPHRAYGTAFDGITDINGWNKIHVFGSNVEQPPEYNNYSLRSIEPDKDFLYSDFRYKNQKGNPYKFRIIRKNPSSRSIRDTLVIMCYNIQNNDKDKLFLVSYIINNIIKVIESS